MPLLSSFFHLYDLIRFHASCLVRGEQVLTVLEPFVLGAGLGMPPSREAFKEAFAFEGTAPRVPYGDWGALGVFDDGRRLRMVSGIPLDSGTSEEFSVSPEGSWIELSDTLPEYARDSMCYVFPGSRIPFYKLLLSGKKLLLRGSFSEEVHSFDEIHGVFGAEFYPVGTILYSRIYSGGVPLVQPRAGNIAGFHCEYDEENATLSVFLLVRSSEKRIRSFSEDVMGWNFSWPSHYDPDYYHLCLSRSWRVRN